ncbi:MAG: TetR/AcrR family transcriptional regulator [Epsilonproteobacteria bacterium]|nr:TetR/AcrR family transcriptional regulator [Campylobacterota bacterium]
MSAGRDSTKTKTTIIYSAMNLFAKNGYDGVSVEHIAKDANINKAMIYYYFKNKATLYETVVKKLLDDIQKTIKNESAKCQNPKEELKSFIYTFASFAQKNPHLPSLMLAELSSGGKNLPEDMFAGLKKIFSLLNKILKNGEKEGYFVEVIPIVIHFMIVGTINLFITTKDLRQRVQNEFDGDVCDDCDVDTIARYIYKKLLKMLQGE